VAWRANSRSKAFAAARAAATIQSRLASRDAVRRTSIKYDVWRPACLRRSEARRAARVHCTRVGGLCEAASARASRRQAEHNLLHEIAAQLAELRADVRALRAEVGAVKARVSHIEGQLRHLLYREHIANICSRR
jgi:flagellin-like hook-associated protein FlgL